MILDKWEFGAMDRTTAEPTVLERYEEPGRESSFEGLLRELMFEKEWRFFGEMQCYPDDWLRFIALCDELLADERKTSEILGVDLETIDEAVRKYSDEITPTNGDNYWSFPINEDTEVFFRVQGEWIEQSEVVA